MQLIKEVSTAEEQPLPRCCVSVLERITALPLTQVADDECEGHMKGRQRCIACHKMVAAGMRAQGRESPVLPAAPDAAPIATKGLEHGAH